MAADLAKRMLKEARDAFRRGAHEEALEKYLWFHHHALDHDLALAGVRLSYALSEWINLGTAYPPARAALEAIQAANIRSIQEGSYDLIRFHDLAAINDRLGRLDLTAAIFSELAQKEPQFARRCFHIALPALTRTQNFALARGFVNPAIGPLDDVFLSLANFLHGKEAREKEALIGVYAKRLRQLVSVLEGVGENEEARLLQTKAVEALTDAEDREELRRQLLWR